MTKLREIVHSRTGDKGNTSNISVIAYQEKHYPLLLAQLSAALGGIEVIASEALGLPGDAKEAFIFAILADETVHGRAANLPSATGASRPAILGKICYPPPR